jgi:hypothetical protein
MNMNSSTSHSPAGEPSRRSFLAAAGLLPMLPATTRFTAPGGTGTADDYQLSYITFDDVTPAHLTPTQSWNSLGLDDQDRVYITWTSTRSDGRDDTALFRYTHRTGHKEFLGSFIDVATAQHNLAAGEQIPKGHTRILQVGRKMYMASMGFHDFKGAIDTLPSYRGSHLFSYDLDTGAFDDVSRSRPGGVVIDHQGIVALNYSPEHRLLVGLSHPLGDIILYDLAANTVRKVVPGIPWQLNHVVSREIVVTRTGKVYTYRGPEDPDLRDVTDEVWEYDLATGAMKGTGQLLKGGFWNGQAVSHNRRQIYLSTVTGQLYRLDVKRGTFTALGPLEDAADYNSPQKYRVAYLYGIGLTEREDKILGWPIIAPTAGDGEAPTRLMSYDLDRQKVSKHFDSPIAAFTGSNHRDRRGNFYQAAFDWDHNCHLAILSPRKTGGH